jgi:general secretion pathway protein D
MKRLRVFAPIAIAYGRAATALLLTALTVVASVASAQGNGQRITPNFKDADITVIAEAVKEATGKNFIIDPRVRAQVTMLSGTPMSPDAFYEAFLSILQVYGFVAVPSGNVIKILPDSNARQLPGDDLPDRISATSDGFVTQVIPVKNISAAQLVPVLRPLIPQNGHLASYASSNILIVSDRASNVSRIMKIIARIDQAGDADVEVATLNNAAATDVVRVVTSLYQAQAAQDGGATSPLKVVADERSNSVIISGEPAARQRIKALIGKLDMPLDTGGDTQVRYMNYADAEKIAAKLKEQVTGVTQGAPGGGGGGPQGATPVMQAERNTTIWADPETNALVITAPPKVMRSLMNVVDKLDIRRPQVLVEAIIVDVNLDKSAELGVNWAAFSDKDDTRIPAGAFITPVGGVNLIDLAREVDSPGTSGKDLSGTTIGIGRIATGGLSFAAMLRALRSDTNSNIISTPSTVTMDNQEAQIKVAQEVPFITGQFSNTLGTGGTNNTTANPFTTIQRQEVGTILKLTPQINEGATVALKIELESSNVLPSSAVPNAVDVTTAKRTISTNVLIEDGGIIVLGGLIQDNFNRSETRVPFLGRIPILGLAFKSRKGQAMKTNLMVFIRPRILRDPTQTARETASKYQDIREQQKRVGARELLPVLPGVKAPVLPPLKMPEQQPSEGPAPTTSAEKEEAARGNQPRTQYNQGQGAEQPQATPQPVPPENPR